MKASIRKGAVVEYIGDEEFKKTWGTVFEVYQKEGNFVRLCSIEKPIYGVVACVGLKHVKACN